MSLKCLDNFMSYTRSPGYMYELPKYNKLGSEKSDVYVSKRTPKAIEQFTDFQKYGVDSLYKCGSCDNRYTLCEPDYRRPEAGCSTGGCPVTNAASFRYTEMPQPKFTSGPRCFVDKKQVCEGYLSPSDASEGYLNLKKFQVKLVSIIPEVEKFFENNGFTLLENLGNRNYIIGNLIDKPNFEVLLANSSVLKELDPVEDLKNKSYLDNVLALQRDSISRDMDYFFKTVITPNLENVDYIQGKYRDFMNRYSNPNYNTNNFIPVEKCSDCNVSMHPYNFSMINNDNIRKFNKFTESLNRNLGISLPTIPQNRYPW